MFVDVKQKLVSMSGQANPDDDARVKSLADNILGFKSDDVPSTHRIRTLADFQYSASDEGGVTDGTAETSETTHTVPDIMPASSSSSLLMTFKKNLLTDAKFQNAGGFMMQQEESEEGEEDGSAKLPATAAAELEKAAALTAEEEQAKIRVITMGGVKVRFPSDKQPFPQQMAIMSKVVGALSNSHNALLESPTGTGKTLALLCSALSWQRHEQARVSELVENAAIAVDVAVRESRAADAGDKKKKKINPQKTENKQRKTKLENSSVEFEGVVKSEEGSGGIVKSEPKPKSNDIDSDSDFENTNEHSSAASSEAKTKMVNKLGGFAYDQAALCANEKQEEEENEAPPSALAAEHAKLALDRANRALELARQVKTPTIFYASRTHTQLTQVAKTLKVLPSLITAGKDGTAVSVRMAILGSREQYCVNSSVIDKVEASGGSHNKNDECQDLISSKSRGCTYHKGKDFLAFRMETVMWDIEDIVEEGNTHTGCPYYAARTLAQSANLILLPYNYLLEPSIRAAMVLDDRIKGSVVVFDEAHNVENVCRDAASNDTNLYAFVTAVKELKECKEHGDKNYIGAYSSLFNIMTQVVAWAKAEHLRIENMPHDKKVSTCPGDEWLIVMNDKYMITDRQLLNLRVNVKAARDGANASLKNESNGLVLSTMTLLTLEGFTNALSFLCSDGGAYARDFRIVLRVDDNADSGDGGGGRGGGGRKQGNRRHRGGAFSGRDNDTSYKQVFVHVWCLNPALAFRSLETNTRSLLLASGTLSPLESFASELDVDFPNRYRLQANHVIDKQQLFSVVLPCGPSPRRQTLSSAYANSQSPLYVEALGQTLVSILPSIEPGGSLCFFPSYGLMKRCVTQWQEGHIWDELQGVQDDVLMEPRGSGDDFKNVMHTFSTVVEGGGRVLFLCVLRGKLSEGIDFSDADCRAVFLCGVPFAPAKDLAVVLKKEYQQLNANQWLKLSRTVEDPVQLAALRKPLSGSEWYSKQAFIAVNQALGRVIRHRNDWGAVIFLDERFAKGHYAQQLSRWMSSSLSVVNNAEVMPDLMRKFFVNVKQHLAARTGNTPIKAPSSAQAQRSIAASPLSQTSRSVSLPVSSQTHTKPAVASLFQVSYAQRSASLQEIKPNLAMSQYESVASQVSATTLSFDSYVKKKSSAVASLLQAKPAPNSPECEYFEPPPRVIEMIDICSDDEEEQNGLKSTPVAPASNKQQTQQQQELMKEQQVQQEHRSKRQNQTLAPAPKRMRRGPREHVSPEYEENVSDNTGAVAASSGTANAGRVADNDGADSSKGEAVQTSFFERAFRGLASGAATSDATSSNQLAIPKPAPLQAQLDARSRRQQAAEVIIDGLFDKVATLTATDRDPVLSLVASRIVNIAVAGLSTLRERNEVAEGLIEQIRTAVGNNSSGSVNRSIGFSGRVPIAGSGSLNPGGLQSSAEEEANLKPISKVKTTLADISDDDDVSSVHTEDSGATEKTAVAVEEEREAEQEDDGGVTDGGDDDDEVDKNSTQTVVGIVGGGGVEVANTDADVDMQFSENWLSESATLEMNDDDSDSKEKEEEEGEEEDDDDFEEDLFESHLKETTNMKIAAGKGRVSITKFKPKANKTKEKKKKKKTKSTKSKKKKAGVSETIEATRRSKRMTVPPPSFSP